MKGYKVVFVNFDGYYTSVCDMYAPVEYKVGTPTKPQENCGPLSCFKRLEDAKAFHAIMNRVLLFWCVFKKSKETEMWNGYERRNPWVSGTILADEITIIGRPL